MRMLLPLLLLPLLADEPWPQFRGTGGTGVSKAKGLPKMGQAAEADRAYRRAVAAGIPVSHVRDTLEHQVLLREARQGRREP